MASGELMIRGTTHAVSTNTRQWRTACGERLAPRKAALDALAFRASMAPAEGPVDCLLCLAVMAHGRKVDVDDAVTLSIYNGPMAAHLVRSANDQAFHVLCGTWALLNLPDYQIVDEVTCEECKRWA